MSQITTKQVQIVQIARRKAEAASNGVFDEAAFRLALVNAGVDPSPIDGRVSSKQLDQAGFESTMALLEEYGYREPNAAADHWRSRCNGMATTRQVYLLRKLADEGRYPLAAMCERATGGRHSQPEQLTVKQAHGLIEAYKAMTNRDRKEADHALSKQHPAQN